ncbi:hypothetical protein METBIDRAFT_13314 [Metschnikowia bicuspidata var. bicuspidata NRRL YB-4993]|uniref:Uncharacterized protein n=1 Tax=Metschnikowia bicuspidata var. bicuspidata NRRL YB-4993 TaxID=869754 RepID=A0A1A0H646_9ASCO|nr:hypothetical protein METBIDRAFT_13314 [Metschnikowia bicuspidata var. bicuspidata NRRL YB-4993]OBA19559.1 hypothetical protein METBIDRAFT_13314 [Metschnikowia bicuspidata var. bicuspidata NRRL YB-4993]
MPALHDIHHKLLAKRYYYGLTSSGARWAYFAIVAVALVLLIASIILVNRKRGRRGAKPIQGTQWMTPPSYYQSQTYYNQPTRRDPNMPSTYVPQYTETANAGDMGYYAPDGTFHPRSSKDGPEFPENAHQRTTANSDGQPIQAFDQTGTRVVADEDIDDFTRPVGPPPGSSGIDGDTTSSNSKEVERPDHPPPSMR